MPKYLISHTEPTSDAGVVESNGTPPGSSKAGIGEGDNKPSVLVSLNRLFCNTAQVITMYPFQQDIYGNCIS
jgi:hypothetical protein